MAVFSTPGSHTYTVPSGVSSVYLRVDGAGGGAGAAAGTNTAAGSGQPGGRATGQLSVSPGDTLYLTVGAAGGDAPSATTAGAGGSGDGAGGTGAQNSANGVDAAAGGGGGATTVRYPSDTQADRVIVGPGGGGGGAAAAPSGVNAVVTTAGPGGGQTGRGVGPGGTTGPDGGDGSSSQIDGASAGAGGGAGQPGGDGGGASATALRERGGGGYGGAFGTSGVSSTATTPGGGQPGDGEIEVIPEPAAPTGVVASEDQAANAIDLSWTDAATTETEYRVYRAQSSGAAPADYTQVATLAADTTSYLDAFGPAQGERYYYRVGAVNQAGVNLAPEVAITTALPAPTGLTVTDTTATTADIAWTNTATNGTVTVQYRRSSASSWTDAATGLSLATESYTISGLLTGEEYDVRVAAVTAHETSLDASNFDVAAGATYVFTKPLTVDDSQFDKPLDNAGTVQPSDQ